MRRIDDPAEHVFAVYGLSPALFDVAPREVIVEPLVFLGELGYATIFHIDGVDFIGDGEREWRLTSNWFSPGRSETRE